MTTTTRLAAAAAALAILATTTACRDELNPPPQTSPTNVQPPPSAPASTTPGTASPSTPAPSATPLTPKEQAEAKAEAVYQAWVKNYAAAATAGFDATKLDSRLATPGLIDYVTKQFKQFKAPGSKGLYTQEIRSMRGTRYVEGKEVQLSLCAVTNLRFIDNGKDVTVLPNGEPAPKTTNPWSNQVQFRSTDGGKTWKAATVVYADAKNQTSC